LLERSDTGSILEANDTDFYSLGFGGWITVKFDKYVEDTAGADLTFYETTNGTYPVEQAKVEVSQDGITWEDAGTVNNKGANTIDLTGTGLSWIQYVRLTDTTDASLHNNAADGYDLNAIYVASALCEEPEDPDPAPKL